ncbi:phosphotransferase family protein [Parvularcula flava]|uniref:Aminoglycoside phosphotransferase n=1 Tax=Aquisalinus luteolus TaxID=1566827 RepID=A0A8J3A9A2_9PROT|nr:phosphotransferase family protein [Aquisalinus luteolus]NHK28641.1 phosphotransferase family protein [Aquisalinus luteolus]GGH99086.1 aminoglycoside phosphotransferase [Aquisalinus luteolus]
MSTGTIETPDRLKFDEEALAAYLNDHVDGFAGPMSVSKFAGGESNPTYLLTTPEKKYVLRRKPPGKLLPSAHAVDREYRIMTALGQQGYPVPKTHVLCEDDSVIGTMFFVMDMVEGRIFWDKVIDDVTPDERRGFFNEAIDNLARLHQIDYQAAGLGDYGKPGNYFARQIERWTKQYKAAETTAIPEIDNLIDWLPSAVPDDDETTIVHGDYKIDNLIYAPGEPKIIATLDWELSTLGHPLADFSYFLMPWSMPQITTLGYSDVDFDAMNIPTIAEASERYCAATGRSALPDLNFCMAYNLFRFSGIVQGVYKRALQGNASSTNAAKYGAVVPMLGQAGWAFAKKAGA